MKNNKIGEKRKRICLGNGCRRWKRLTDSCTLAISPPLFAWRDGDIALFKDILLLPLVIIGMIIKNITVTTVGIMGR